MSHTPALSRFGRTALVAASLLVLGACATQPPAPVNLAASVAANPSLSTFNTLAAQGGLAETLKSGGPYTVFAPTNDAFKAMPAAAMDDLNKHPEKLKDLLGYHVVVGKLTAAEVKNSNAKALNGASLALSKAGDFVTVENAAVVVADLGATNGVVHTIDTVLTPPKK